MTKKYYEEGEIFSNESTKITYFQKIFCFKKLKTTYFKSFMLSHIESSNIKNIFVTHSNYLFYD